MLILLFALSCHVGTLLGCAPGFKYIPPNVGTTTQDTCRDCTRNQRSEQFRFFTDLPCCSQSSNKVGPERLKNATSCGRKGGPASPLRVSDNKVVGGTPALENELPWQVALLLWDGNWGGCGAILISCDPVIVITAAHCVVISQLTPNFLNPIPLPAEIFKVAFGAHALSADQLGKNEVRMDVEEIIVHPSFARYTVHAGISLRNNLNVTQFENDIAVIKVKNGSDLQCKREAIWPACLPIKDTEYAGWNRTILSGWGKVAGNESITLSKPRKLRKASIPIISDNECSKNWNLTIFEKQLCAGDIVEGRGACSGDSGGPLVAEDPNQDGWSAVGIVSWGSTGCDTDKLDVFTEIGQYLEWIGSQFGLLPPE